MLQERPEADVEVVRNDVRVILDVGPHDPLAGPLVACHVLGEPREVPLQLVPLHISAAECREHGGRVSGEEARVRLEATAPVPLVRTGAREDGRLTDNLGQEARVRV